MEFFQMFSGKMQNIQASFKYLTEMNFIKFSEIFQNMFYLLGKSKEDINKPNTNVFDWRKTKGNLINYVMLSSYHWRSIRTIIQLPIGRREKQQMFEVHVHRSDLGEIGTPGRRESKGVLLPHVPVTPTHESKTQDILIKETLPDQNLGH
jgi:hypothetical protein